VVVPRVPNAVATASEAAASEVPPLLILEPLAAVLDANGLGSGALEATEIGGGHSNATFLLRRGDERWVLRRPPLPPYPPSTHDVLREFTILRSCIGAVRVPEPLLSVDDIGVIGAPFYLMSYVPGAVITTEVPPGLDSPEQRRAITDELVEGLVRIHALDWRAAGLGDLQRGDDYVGRQLRRFSGLWDQYKRRPIPAIDEAFARLGELRPPAKEQTLVHGDYRLGNTIFSTGSPPRLQAIVDWEMASIGDPLADLGYLTSTWAEPDDREGALLDLGVVTTLPGFGSRADLVAAYESHSGRAAESLPWYEALASWKSAVLLEGSYQRSRGGVAAGTFFDGLEAGVPGLAERAVAALDRLR
jgi:aminoglycoside phosphotransferase (APT) family kinase protein